MPYFPPSGGGSTLTTPVSIANGGTGSSTQNFVDLTNTQTVNGTKTLQTSSPSSKGLIVKGSTSTGSSPATITTNLALWLKADAITGTSSGGSLATWLDSSAAGNNATQATSGTQPTYITNQINGYPIVRFNGAQNMAISLAALVSSSYTIIVVEARAASGTQYLLGSNSNTPYSVMNENIQFGYRAGTTFTLAQYSNDLNATISDYSTKTFNIDEGTLDTSVGHTIYQNGTSIASNSNVTPATVLNAPEIGGAAGGGAFNGDIAEIIIYSTILTTAQRQNIEMYLGNKYGITTAAASSQSVDLQEWQSPTSGVLSAIDQNGNHIPGTTNTVSMGNSTTYWLANYATTHYFNSTSYISGATAGTAALTGNLTVSGGLTSSAGSALTGNVRYNSQINTTSQTITTSQPMFQIGNSTSAITLTLPATTTVGYAYTLTNINTGLVTVVATINGATNYVLSQWQSITVFSTSTSGSWYSANNLATYSAQTNISANYTVLPNDSNIFATGTITVTLPSAVVFGGREITIYNVGTGTITVAATAGTVSIASIAAAGGAPANNSVAYVSNGTNWYTA
jgi:hypothetical protein